jgi:hypothetical protein
MRRLTVGLIPLAVLLAIGQVQGDVFLWSVANGGNGHSYEPVLAPAGITWFAAHDAAVADGGYLATITSAAENDFVYNLISSSSYWCQPTIPQDVFGPWLGGYQDHSAPNFSEPAGGWTWGTGEPWGYNNWWPGMPDNNDGWFGGPEDYLHFFSRSGSPQPTWNDLNPTLHPIRGYVVEFNAAPDPSTFALLGAGAIPLFLYTLRRRKR